jgi:arylsulfatase A-like enzyme
VLLLSVLLACHHEPDPVPTDTVPQFLGPLPKNLIFLSMDTFRKDRLGAFGGVDTPYLDTLADEGALLENHTLCADWTYPGTTCTLLGRRNEENGFVQQLVDDDRFKMPEDTDFLATWLRRDGYVTVLESSNSWLGPKWRNDQGYQRSDVPDNRAAWNVAELGLAALDEVRADEPDAPFFLHLHFKEPHAPYDPPAEYIEAEADLPPLIYDLSTQGGYYQAINTWGALSADDRELLDEHLQIRYAGEVRWLDDEISDLMKDLDDKGLLDDTLVVFWTDHGEGFWEHDTQGHAYQLFHEENDGFVILWAKNIVPMRWDGPTFATDIVPTVLGLLDQPVPDVVTGVPLGTADEHRPRFGLAVGRIGPVQSVLVDNVRMQFWWRTGRVMVHDRNVDPDETTDLYDATDPAQLALWNVLLPEIERTVPLVENEHPTWPADWPHPTE